MKPDQFLDTLSHTAFGSVILINMYRSVQVGTLSDKAIKGFIDDCLSTFNAHTPVPTSKAELSDLALRSAKDWTTRAASSRANRYPVASTDVDASQFGTVIHYKTLVANARSSTHKTYAKRRATSANGLNALVAEWQKDGATWILGNGRDFFWIALPIDWSNVPGARLSQGVAQIYRDILGLCHWGKNDTLVRIIIPSDFAKGLTQIFRPTAFDGLDNPAFRAGRDGETNANADFHGQTVDIHKVTHRDATVDGVGEWICAPAGLPAANLFWEYLGVPDEPKCCNTRAFHKAMSVALGRATPMSAVLPFLKSCVA